MCIKFTHNFKSELMLTSKYMCMCECACVWFRPQLNFFMIHWPAVTLSCCLVCRPSSVVCHLCLCIACLVPLIGKCNSCWCVTCHCHCHGAFMLLLFKLQLNWSIQLKIYICISYIQLFKNGYVFRNISWR